MTTEGYTGEIISFAGWLWDENCFEELRRKCKEGGDPIFDEEFCSVDDDEPLEDPICNECGMSLRRPVEKLSIDDCLTDDDRREQP